MPDEQSNVQVVCVEKLSMRQGHLIYCSIANSPHFLLFNQNNAKSLAHKAFLGLSPADLPLPFYSNRSYTLTPRRTEEQLCGALGLRRACAVFADLRTVQNGISPVRTAEVKDNCLGPPVTQSFPPKFRGISISSLFLLPHRRMATSWCTCLISFHGLE